MESFNQIMMQELAETLSEPPCITPIVQIITYLAKGVNKKSNNFLLTPSRKFDTFDENQSTSAGRCGLMKFKYLNR